MGNLEAPKKRVPKMVFFDVETSPYIGSSFSPRWDARIIDVLWDWKLLCFAYRWAHRAITKVVAQPDFDDYDSTARPFAHLNDYNVTKALWDLLDEADVVCAYNGDKFDIKAANTRFFEHGLGPPSPYQSVDPIKPLRRRMKNTSNKMDDIAKIVGSTGKMDSSYSLWRGCMKGDAASWRKMAAYNKADVNELITVYLSVLPFYDRGHPHMGMLAGELDGCRNCGSTDIVLDGYTYTASRIHETIRCNACGSYGKTTKSLAKIAARYT